MSKTKTTKKFEVRLAQEIDRKFPDDVELVLRVSSQHAHIIDLTFKELTALAKTIDKYIRKSKSPVMKATREEILVPFEDVKIGSIGKDYSDYGGMVLAKAENFNHAFRQEAFALYIDDIEAWIGAGILDRDDTLVMVRMTDNEIVVYGYGFHGFYVTKEN